MKKCIETSIAESVFIVLNWSL